MDSYPEAKPYDVVKDSTDDERFRLWTAFEYFRLMARGWPSGKPTSTNPENPTNKEN